MAIRHIREAFDQEAAGQAFCQKALLRYEDDGKGHQHQIITVSGYKPDGTTFTLATPAHAMDADPHEQVRILARSLKEVDPASAEGAGERPPTAGSIGRSQGVQGPMVTTDPQ
jgi:hypothetical protein